MTPPTREEIVQLVVARLSEVVAVEPDTIGETARFEEDLAADSLDRLEVLEGVEADLRSRGVHVALPDDVVQSVSTVGEAVARLHGQAPEQPAVS